MGCEHRALGRESMPGDAKECLASFLAFDRATAGRVSSFVASLNDCLQDEDDQVLESGDFCRSAKMSAEALLDEMANGPKQGKHLQVSCRGCLSPLPWGPPLLPHSCCCCPVSRLAPLADSEQKKHPLCSDVGLNKQEMDVDSIS